ncbi:MAG: autotransporter outer membrane beta-barrel domain-containing protein, partial [Pseudomonadota bacterium]
TFKCDVAIHMSITGDFTNMTDLVSNGALTVGGDFAMDAGDLTIANGSGQVDGDVTFASDVNIAMSDGTTFSGNTVSNAGTLQSAGSVSFAGDFENTGAITSDGDLSFGGAFTNGGSLIASGSLAFAGGLQNTTTVNLINDDPSDRITVGGAGLSGGGTLEFDVDLSDEVGQADQVTMSPGAFITGDVTLRFNVLGSGAQQPVDLVLIDVAAGDPGNFSITADEIVDPSGILTYSVTRNATGDVVIEDALTPGIAGLAGNIVLTQSLIGSVVNRPSSPFVTSLAYDDENPCGSGLWGRAIGGGATSIGEVSEIGAAGGAFDGRISATFSGFQLGGDFACFNGAVNGWDLAFGAIGGLNVGQTTQPVFAIDLEVEGNLSDLQTSTTTVDFTQLYTGVYATAVRGPWAVDLQYRFESTDFTATNTGAGDLPGLGLDETNFSSFATTLSGAASYVYNVPDTNMALVPTAGFAFTQVSTDEIDFESRGTVLIDDFDSRIGFVGGTLAISHFGDDGVSAYREFVSATIYNDFADGPRSTFSPVDESGDRRLRTENLGLYSEISVGVNYIKVLQENEFGAVKQLSANARADLRISERLKSWGITAQARYQF